LLRQAKIFIESIPFDEDSGLKFDDRTGVREVLYGVHSECESVLRL